MVTALAATGLGVGFPGAPGVLRNADLSLTSGRRLALLGANGSGKSTLLRCLSGALKPDAGEVSTRDGTLRHTRRALSAHRQRVQLILQDPNDQLFATDVRQDVAFGPLNLGLPPDEVDLRVESSLAALGISGLVERPVHHLSYGQRKRVALAGAVAMRPSVLLLDEPTAGLDPAGVRALFTVLADLETAGITVALSTHDVDLAWAWADEVAILLEGRVHVGPTATMLADLPLLADAELAAPWQVRFLREAGLTLAPGAERPRDVADLLALLRAAGL